MALRLKWQVIIVFGILFMFSVIFWQVFDRNAHVNANSLTQYYKRRPNIIAIIADDLGWNDVGFHGSNQIPTPNIDALAYYGVILQRHYVLPICTPSRTALLTGKYPIRTGMQGYPLRAGEPRGIPLNLTLLPSHLQHLGYATHLVGKWHVGYYTEQHTPTSRGFDTFYGGYSGYIQYFNHTIRQNNHTGYDLHRNRFSERSIHYSGKYVTDLFTEEAEHIIESHNKTKPLYLQLAYTAPHSSDAEDPLEVRDEKEMNETLGYIKDMTRRKYASMVTTMDESVGRVVSALKRTGMLKDSIILFMSDNGAPTLGALHKNDGSNYPLRGIKTTVYEGGIRGAACIYSPLIKAASRVSDQLMHITDWLPTLYSAAGGNVNNLNGLDGVDQWYSIKYGTEGKRLSVLFNIDEVSNQSAALIGRYKLLKDHSELSGHYGDSGFSDSYPAYNLSKVLSSEAAVAIESVSRVTLSTKRIISMRENSIVTCKNVTEHDICKEQCLFDVYSDPCESTDLFEKYPNIVRELNDYINSYNSVIMKQTNKPVDPASYPEHFNGTWMPWRNAAR